MLDWRGEFESGGAAGMTVLVDDCSSLIKGSETVPQVAKIYSGTSYSTVVVLVQYNSAMISIPVSDYSILSLSPK